MSVQRKRGRPIVIFKDEAVEDSRGNIVLQPVLLLSPGDDTFPGDDVFPEDDATRRCWAIAQRSSKGEVAGQRSIDVMRVGIDYNALDDVGLWSQAHLDGRVWDIAAPPLLRWGTRRTRHWSVDLRARGDARVDAIANG